MLSAAAAAAAAAHCSYSFSGGLQASPDSSHPPLLGCRCKRFTVPTPRRVEFRRLGSDFARRVYRETDGGSGGQGGMGGSGGGGGHGDGAFGKAGGVGLFSSLWARYMQLLEENPLITKSLTAGLLNLFADLVCQLFLEKVSHVDVQRALSFTAIGLFMSGPGLHFWYGMLPKLIPVPGFPGVLLRLGADQLVFTPLGVATFFFALCTFEGRQHEIETKLRKDWLPLVLANWKVWIPFQLINFGVVPPQLQVAAASLMGVVWSIFISFIGHN